MPDTYILYDGNYSGQEIDAFLSRIERTAGDGPLQPELAGTIAREVPHDEYVQVTKQIESDGSITLIFGIPRGTDGRNGRDGRDGVDGKSALEYALEAGYTGTEQEFAAGLSELAESMPISREAVEKSDEAIASAAAAAASEAAAAASEAAAASSEAEATAQADRAQAEADRASVPPIAGVYNVILTDRVTEARYALIVESGRIVLLEVSPQLEAQTLVYLDKDTGIPYNLIVESGRLKLEEASV